MNEERDPLKTHRFGLFLGAVLVALFVAFWTWQTPGNLQKLSSADVDAYLHKLEGKLPGNPDEQAVLIAIVGPRMFRKYPSRAASTPSWLAVIPPAPRVRE